MCDDNNQLCERLWAKKSIVLSVDAMDIWDALEEFKGDNLARMTAEDIPQSKLDLIAAEMFDELYDPASYFQALHRALASQGYLAEGATV